VSLVAALPDSKLASILRLCAADAGDPLRAGEPTGKLPGIVPSPLRRPAAAR